MLIAGEHFSDFLVAIGCKSFFPLSLSQAQDDLNLR